MKLFGARFVEGGGAPGEIRTTDDGLQVATGRGVIAIDDIQPSGKSRMAAADWVRGRGAQVGQRFA